MFAAVITHIRKYLIKMKSIQVDNKTKQKYPVFHSIKPCKEKLVFLINQQQKKVI